MADIVFPDDLPLILEYRCPCPLGVIVLTTLPRRPVQHISTSGKTDSPIVKPTIPIGADAWRRANEEEWHPLKTLPKSWMPFLNRTRGTVMDPRRVPEEEKDKETKVAKDAIRDEVHED